MLMHGGFMEITFIQEAIDVANATVIVRSPTVVFVTHYRRKADTRRLIGAIWRCSPPDSDEVASAPIGNLFRGWRSCRVKSFSTEVGAADVHESRPLVIIPSRHVFVLVRLNHPRRDPSSEEQYDDRDHEQPDLKDHNEEVGLPRIVEQEEEQEEGEDSERDKIDRGVDERRAAEPEERHQLRCSAHDRIKLFVQHVWAGVHLPSWVEGVTPNERMTLDTDAPTA